MPCEELLNEFRLLCDLLRQPGNARHEELLDGLNKVILEKIPETFTNGAPPEYFDWYTDLQKHYEHFRNFILYDKLIGKNVVALGGGFSSGKSSFLNAIDGERALPTDIDPATAVPTFIVNGDKHQAFAVNIFDSIIPIGLPDIRKISHGFGEIRDEDGELLSEPLILGHVLESVFLASPKQKYENLAFVDTPGFSKPDADMYVAKTDKQISRGQWDASSYIILFVQADAGTLKDEDIRFIQSLRADIPKLFIISKADLKTERELEGITAHIRSQLTLSGIAHMDVLTFSDRSPSGYGAPAIHTYLAQWNETVNTPQFARNFKRLFIKCRSYYEEDIENERRQLEHINKVIIRIENEDAETLGLLRQLVKEGQARVNRLKKSYDNMRDLKDMLFTELKRVCDQIGIDMPEPSEVDMREDIPDPLVILRDFKKQNGIRTNPRTLESIREAFSGVKSVLDSAAGGSAHRDAIVQLIKANCRVNEKRLRDYDAENRAGAYAAVIQSLTNISETLRGSKS